MYKNLAFISLIIAGIVLLVGVIAYLSSSFIPFAFRTCVWLSQTFLLASINFLLFDRFGAKT